MVIKKHKYTTHKVILISQWFLMRERVLLHSQTVTPSNIKVGHTAKPSPCLNPPTLTLLTPANIKHLKS